MNRVRTDAAAHTHARQQLAGHLVGICLTVDENPVELDAYDAIELAEVVTDAYAVTFQRYVNEHGVAVRRVVMYGPEECDPAVLATRSVAEPVSEPAIAEAAA